MSWTKKLTAADRAHVSESTKRKTLGEVKATKRAQMARKALQTTVWMGCKVRAAQERLAMQAKDGTRGFFLACEAIDSD